MVVDRVISQQGTAKQPEIIPAVDLEGDLEIRLRIEDEENSGRVNA